VVRQPDDHAIPECPQCRILDKLASVLIDDAEHVRQRLTCRLFKRPPGHGLRDGIEKADPPLGIGDDDGIPDAPERDPKLLGLLASFGDLLPWLGAAVGWLVPLIWIGWALGVVLLLLLGGAGWLLIGRAEPRPA